MEDKEGGKEFLSLNFELNAQAPMYFKNLCFKLQILLTHF